MKQRLLNILQFLFLCSPLMLSAATVKVSWDPSTQATGYRVYMSTDQGASWNLQAESPTLPIDVLNVPDTGLVLLRACAVEQLGSGEVCRTETGFFYNGEWSPLTVENLTTP